MAEQQVKERVKRKTEEEKLATRKESKKKYESTSHILRITKTNFERWSRYKKEFNLKTNDEVASALLDQW